jgi:hypothetical protein
MFRALIIALTAVALLAATGVAGASNGKQRVVVERLVEEYSFVAVDCGDFGPYAFSIEVEGRLRVSVVDVLADDGSLLQTVFHFVLDETDTNSVSGKNLPLHGVKNEVWDYGSNTVTGTGGVYIGTEPGQGTYVQDTGRIVMTLDTRIAQFVAGPHEAFFGGGIEAVLCAALADG